MGIIYNAGEDNSRVLVEITRGVAKELRLELVDATVTNSGEVFAATQTLVGRVDGIYTIQDNTVISALESVIKVANKNRIPVLVPGIPKCGTGWFGNRRNEIIIIWEGLLESRPFEFSKEPNLRNSSRLCQRFRCLSQSKNC